LPPIESRGAALDEEAADVPLLVARPHDDDVGDRGVADPALLAVEYPVLAVVAGGRLQRHRI
jgi:hypothetical protein